MQPEYLQGEHSPKWGTMGKHTKWGRGQEGTRMSGEHTGELAGVVSEQVLTLILILISTFTPGVLLLFSCGGIFTQVLGFVPPVLFGGRSFVFVGGSLCLIEGFLCLLKPRKYLGVCIAKWWKYS